MGQFDQTMRPMAKLDGASFFGWALACCEPRPKLAFVTWDDTRWLVIPGEPESTNDLVALMRDADYPDRPTWMIAEIEAEPERGIFYRAARYEIQLGEEVNPACEPAGPAVCCLVLNLTGTQQPPRLEWSFAGGAFGTRVAPFVVNVAGQDATTTLARIEAGEVGLTILPLLALMQGGGTKEFITQWKRVVESELEEPQGAEYREAALVLAELTRYQVTWLKETEGWMVRESTYIKSWEKKGAEADRILSKRESLLQAIEYRFNQPVPEAIRLAIEGTNDLATLQRWFESACRVSTLADLRRNMRLDPET